MYTVGEVIHATGPNDKRSQRYAVRPHDTLSILQGVTVKKDLDVKVKG
jgi:hypothetical protein